MSSPEYYRLTIETADGRKRRISSREVTPSVLVENRQNSNIKGITLALTGHSLPYDRIDDMLNRLLEKREFIPVRFMELEYIRICFTMPEYGDPRYERYLIEGNQPDIFQDLDDDLMQEDEPHQRETDPLTVLDPNQELDASWLQEKATLEYICQLCELLRVSVRKIYFPMPERLTADIFYFPGDSLARGEKWHRFFNWLAGEKQRVNRDIDAIKKEEQEYRQRSLVALDIAASSKTQRELEALAKKEARKELKSFLWNGPIEKESCVIL